MLSPPSSSSSARATETCARLILGSSGTRSDSSSVVFLKGTWHATHFSLSITDGLHCWICTATEEAVADRAAGWDESVVDYLQRAQFYLSHQHPESTYSFVPDGDNRKFSWTMEKHGTKLEGKWRCERAKNDQQINCDILDFLMDANVKLSDEVLRKTQSFERMKAEAEKCLQQSERFKNEKQQFEIEIFQKFVAVLNSKKAKLRELRDKLSRLEPRSGNPEAEDDIEDETDVDEGGDDSQDDAGSDDERHKPAIMSEDVQEAQNANDIDVKTSVSENNAIAGKDTSREQTVNPSQEQGGTGADADSAAALLAADTTYTSAPKRRRHL